MTRKGGVATCEALARQGSSLRFLQRHAGVAGRGMDPCPEPESGAVLLLGKRSAQAPGIVTRKGGNRKVAVSVANRARKGAQLDLFAEQLVTPAATVIQVDLPDADHNLGIDTASFYGIYHEHWFSPLAPEVRWAQLRWSIDGYRDFQVNEVSNRNYDEYLRNMGAWLSKRIFELGGLASAW